MISIACNRVECATMSENFSKEKVTWHIRADMQTLAPKEVNVEMKKSSFERPTIHSVKGFLIKVNVIYIESINPFKNVINPSSSSFQAIP